MPTPSSFACNRFSGENIGPPALVLNIGIWVSLDDLLDVESFRPERARDLLNTKKVEVNGDFLTPPLIQMNRLLADVEGEQQETARSQNSPKLAQRPRHIAARDVDDRVEGDEACPSSVGCVQRSHVALSELDLGSQASRSFHHCGRQVNSTNLNALLMQVTSDVSGAATHVTSRADGAHARRKSVKQLSVEWLVPQLIEDAPDVFVGHLVVAGLAVVLPMSIHLDLALSPVVHRNRVFGVPMPRVRYSEPVLRASARVRSTEPVAPEN
jgi:hypothetical protein